MPGIILFPSPASDPVVSPSLNQSIRAILLDVEGCTTPIDFVYKVLFPYARSHVQGFLKRHGSSPDVQKDVAELRREHLEDTRQNLNPPALNDIEPDSIVSYFHWLTDRDRKSTPLKSLQGKIWEEGYAHGKLCSHMFEDVPAALKRWQEENKKIAIFSSGSILAQRLLFAHTTSGDLTRYLSAHFDTTIGTKTDPVSYRRIANAMQCSPSAIIFISDLVTELNAATCAGLRTLLSERPGNHPQPSNSFQVIRSLDELNFAQGT